MKNWYLIKTKPRQEKTAKQNLENQNYEVFCPIAKINNRLVVLFPGYLFVSIKRKIHKIGHLSIQQRVSHILLNSA